MKRILITGEHVSLPAKTESGEGLEWVQIPVLDYQRVPVDETVLQRALIPPPHWIIFTSPRGVAYWVDTLVDAALELSPETRVACIGKKTAESAEPFGMAADFLPTGAGTETFLEEFLPELESGAKILLPMAEGGRPTLARALAQKANVTVLFVYRSVPREAISVSSELLERSDLLLFTSPSSVDALRSRVALPTAVPVGAMGTFTFEHLKTLGFKNPKVLPEGDFDRIGELL